MSRFDSRAFERVGSFHGGRMLALGASVATLVGLSVLVTGGFAQSSDDSRDIAAAAQKRGYVPVCTQRRGGNASKGDLNIRLRAWCAKGQKPLKLALYPVAQQAPQPSPPGTANVEVEYGVGNVFVARGGNKPSRWATYTTPLGSPVGSTTGGQFRFSCTPAQSPCKISLGAAILSSDTGRGVVYVRMTVQKESGSTAGAPLTNCEYVDGGPNRIPREPLSAAIGEIREPLTMDAGSSYDCEASQTGDPPGRTDEIWVESSSNIDTAYYDVWTTWTFARESG